MRQQIIPTVGERIGRYEIVSELGQGGFGVVYLARQVGIDAQVAIKLLLVKSNDEAQKLQVVDRFRQEAEIIKRLEHPCALKIRDFGTTEDGAPYLVTEYVRGTDLDKVIKEQPLTIARTVRVGGQILGCLAEAHSLGVVHRDLKPANIKVRDIVGEKDAVKVLDFGIAKLSDDEGGLQTQTGAGFGTPYYMSPEQCRGEKLIDGRADIYALGLILAECLTGQRVVQADSTLAAIYFQVNPNQHDYPPELRQCPLFPVIERATQKNRDWRYPEALAMREELLRISTTGVSAHQVIIPPGSPSHQTPPNTGPAPSSDNFDLMPTAHAVPQYASYQAPSGQVPSGQIPSGPTPSGLAPNPPQTGKIVALIVAIFVVFGVLVAGIWMVTQSNSGDDSADDNNVTVTEVEENTGAPSQQTETDPNQVAANTPADPEESEPSPQNAIENPFEDPTTNEEVAAVEEPTEPTEEEDHRPILLVQASGDQSNLRRVLVTIESNPDGAIVRDADGNVLAHTPFDGYIASTSVEVVLTLANDGYRSTRIEVDLMADQPQHFEEELRRRRRSNREETTEPTPDPQTVAEPEEPPASPFGQTQVYGSDDSDPPVNPFGTTQEY